MERSVARAPATPIPTQRAAEDGDADLLTRLRAGDEAAFTKLVEQWSRTMLHVARSHVSTQDSAREVVQETWLAVIKGLDSFEGRSSLKTWTFRILVNTAKSRGVREARSVPMSSLASEDDGGPTVDPDRFRGPDDRWPGHWTVQGAPQRWRTDPSVAALRTEVRDLLGQALESLPVRQREVVVLRDVQGCDSEEVCAILDLSPANQRVLLHRGRAKLRAALEDYYRRGEQ
jgi:RNA polymerase sigma-70 factor, ECF subfamily